MKTSRNHTKITIALALIAAACAATTFAQQPATQGAAIATQPGKATIAQTVDVSAEITGLDKAKRVITLKGPQGNSLDIVAGDEVKNFDKLKVGDVVSARYVESLTLEVKKTTVAKADPVVREGVVRSKTGEQPAGAVMREVTAIVDVTAVDPAKSTITIKGPTGNVRTLNVKNPDQFKVVKVGDHIEVTYTEALAVSVEPAPAKK